LASFAGASAVFFWRTTPSGDAMRNAEDIVVSRHWRQAEAFAAAAMSIRRLASQTSEEKKRKHARVAVKKNCTTRITWVTTFHIDYIANVTNLN
jgi:hypothetical protein